MLKLKKIAVTGGVSCGKSTVCLLLKKLGAYYVSTDEIVHTLLIPSTTLGNQLVQLLGKEILLKGSFSRDRIAEKVFENPELLRKLEALIHPPVLQEIKKLYEKAEKERKYPLFVVEIPLLYEIGEEKSYDFVILVTCQEEVKKKRSRSFLKIKEREKRTLSSLEKEKKADFILKNDTGIEDLTKQVQKIYQQLT